MPQQNDDPFDWDAYYRDTRCLSPDARGVWMDCLYHLRLSPIQGQITLSLNALSGMFGVPPKRAQQLLNEIAECNVGECVTNDNGKVTVINRRMYRQWREREGNKNRQSEYRERQRENERNGIVAKPEKPPLVVEVLNPIKKEKKQRQRIPTSRIPDPFPLTDEMIEWAKTTVPGLRVIEAHENFVEYWTNNTTAKAEKVDWMLTWKKGMKLAYTWQKPESVQGNKITGRQMIAQEQESIRQQFAQ